MNAAQSQLLKGALKSAVGAVAGLLISLPLVDPMTFNFSSLGGWRHLLTVIVAVVVIAEARYWKQWSESPADDPKIPVSQVPVRLVEISKP